MEVDLDLSVVFDRQQQNSIKPFIKEAILSYSYTYKNNYKISRNVFNIKCETPNTESFSINYEKKSLIQYYTGTREWQKEK